MPLTSQVPAPALVSARAPPTLSARTPAKLLSFALVPCRVKVLAPEPEKVGLLVKLTSAVPDESMVAPPVVPAKSITRSVLLAVVRFKTRVPVLAALPMAMVPRGTVAGAPNEVLPPPTLPIEVPVSAPAVIDVRPV